MKNYVTSVLAIVAMILLFAACRPPQDIPIGCWQSLQGRPSLTLKKDSAGNYCAIIHHRTADGRACPVAYPLVRGTYGLYIRAHVRILVSYTAGDGILFLSPGGAYQLKKGNIKQ